MTNSVCRRASPEVPTNTRDVDQVNLALAPGVVRGWLCPRTGMALEHARRLDVLPPRIEILDRHVHHEVLLQGLVLVVLQDEDGGAR